MYHYSSERYWKYLEHSCWFCIAIAILLFVLICTKTLNIPSFNTRYLYIQNFRHLICMHFFLSYSFLNFRISLKVNIDFSVYLFRLSPQICFFTLLFFILTSPPLLSKLLSISITIIPISPHTSPYEEANDDNDNWHMVFRSLFAF